MVMVNLSMVDRYEKNLLQYLSGTNHNHWSDHYPNRADHNSSQDILNQIYSQCCYSSKNINVYKLLLLIIKTYFIKKHLCIQFIMSNLHKNKYYNVRPLLLFIMQKCHSYSKSVQFGYKNDSFIRFSFDTRKIFLILYT